MKTSNKLLLSMFGLVCLIIIVAAVSIKKRLVKTLEENRIECTVEQVKQLPEFSQLHIAQGVHVFFSQSESNECLIKADSTIIDNVFILASDGKLSIGLSDAIEYGKVEIFLKAKELEKLNVRSGSMFDAENEIVSPVFELSAGEGAIANLMGRFNSLNVHANTGSIVSIKGSSDYLRMESNTGTIINASDLKVKHANITANTGAVTNIWVTDSVYANASLGAIINYKGKPPVVAADELIGGMVNQD